MQSKTAKTFQFSKLTIAQIEELSQKLGCKKTEIIEWAINQYYLGIKLQEAATGNLDLLVIPR